jgi:prepilin-type N-terminal cleavage/methylation domain-containing protein
MRLASRTDRGFSLVELMVAMLVTMIISSAIYGLMAGGQNAFRREPELSDRQQNIRVAMDMIMRDVGNAGAGMPTFMQTFTRGLNACSGCADGGAPMGLDNERTDELEIITNDSSRDNEVACADPGNNAASNLLRIARQQTSISVNQPLMIIFDDGTWTFREVAGDPSANNGAADLLGRCAAGTHAQLDFRQGGDLSGMNTPGGYCRPSGTGLGNAGGPTDCVGGTCGTSITACPTQPTEGPPCCMVREIAYAEVVRYRIRNDATGVPVLQRTSTANPGVWNTVASGIEDLQVQYTQADGTLTAGAPGAPQVLMTPSPNNYASLITQVQVTLSARAEAQNLQGATQNASGATRVRGRLVSTGSPRATLVALTQQTPAPPTYWK